MEIYVAEFHLSSGTYAYLQHDMCSASSSVVSTL